MALFQHSHNLLMTRDLHAAAPVIEKLPDLRVLDVASDADAGFGPLDAMCDASGFPAGWTGRMLLEGARASVVCTVGDKPIVAGSGWCTLGPFWVEEIGCTFDPGEQGIYLFGNFVRPEYRRRHVQRVLVQHRLSFYARQNRRWMFAMLHERNIASFKNLTSSEFRATCRQTIWSSRIARLDRLTHLDPSLPFGQVLLDKRPLHMGINVCLGKRARDARPR